MGSKRGQLKLYQREINKQTNKQTKNGAVALYWRPSEDGTAFGFYQTVLTLWEALMKLWVHVWRNEVLSKNYLVTSAAGRKFSPWSSGICPIDENQAIENYKWVGLWMDFQFFSSVMSISVQSGDVIHPPSNCWDWDSLQITSLLIFYFLSRGVYLKRGENNIRVTGLMSVAAVCQLHEWRWRPLFS